MKRKYKIMVIWASVAGLILTLFFVEGATVFFFTALFFFIFIIVPIGWCWIFGGLSKIDELSVLLGGGALVMLFFAFVFQGVGTTVSPGLSKFSEPLLCPSGYENLIARRTGGGASADFSLLCKGEKGRYRPNKIIYRFILGGFFVIYAFGGMLLTLGVHDLFIGNLSTIRRRQLSVFLTLPLIPMLYFLPGWIAWLTGPWVW